MLKLGRRHIPTRSVLHHREREEISPSKSSSRRRILAVTSPRICRAVTKSAEVLSERGRPLLHDDYRSFAQSDAGLITRTSSICLRWNFASARTPAPEKYFLL